MKSGSGIPVGLRVGFFLALVFWTANSWDTNLPKLPGGVTRRLPDWAKPDAWDRILKPLPVNQNPLKG
jgi:hypothetical protein